MTVVIVWIVIAIASGAIASAKGRSFFGYFVLGFLLSIIGLLIAIGIPSLKPALVVAQQLPEPVDERPRKKCPACAEEVLAEATKCRFCGERMPQET